MDYLHGYKNEEQDRLEKQASFLQESIFKNVTLDNYSNLLELGCGTGAQSKIILKRYPKIKITGLDISSLQIQKAKNNFSNNSYANRINFKKISINKIPFDQQTFDAAFICWVLEHSSNPEATLKEVYRVLQKNAVIYISEVFNQSFYLSTITPSIKEYWNKFNQLQQHQNGHPNIGIELGSLLKTCGFNNIKTTPLIIHVDNSDAQKRMKALNYWKELLLSGKESLLENKLIDNNLVANFKNDFDTLADDPKTVMFFCAFQARANK